MPVMQNPHIIAAAIGAAIGIISAATVFFYNKVLEKQQHSAMKSNIDKVNRKILELETEVQELRQQQANCQKNKRRRRRRVYSTDNSVDNTDNDTCSVYSTFSGTDIGDDEFYDCSEDEVDDIWNKTIGESLEEDQELIELFKEQEDDTLYADSYHKLKVLLNKYPYNVELIWRFARSCYHCSLKDEDKHKEYVLEGCEACEKVLNQDNDKLYEWYAILIGLKTKFLPLKERIRTGFEFKNYVEKAIEINPSNGFLYYLLGRFKFEISELNWLEKKFTAAFLAEVPNENYNDAILDFQKAEELSSEPNYTNKLYLSKSYIALGNFKEAITWLSQIKNIKTTNIEDTKIQNEAETLLEKYCNYNTELKN